MKALAQFIVRLTELAEAEGRAAQRGLFRLALALLLLWLVALLALIGVGLIGGALYLVFARVIAPAGALAIVGGLALLLALIGLLIALLLRPTQAGARR